MITGRGRASPTPPLLIEFRPARDDFQNTKAAEVARLWALLPKAVHAADHLFCGTLVSANHIIGVDENGFVRCPISTTAAPEVKRRKAIEHPAAVQPPSTSQIRRSPRLNKIESEVKKIVEHMRTRLAKGPIAYFQLLVEPELLQKYIHYAAPWLTSAFTRQRQALYFLVCKDGLGKYKRPTAHKPLPLQTLSSSLSMPRISP
jgi:hypothetical protein